MAVGPTMRSWSLDDDDRAYRLTRTLRKMATMLTEKKVIVFFNQQVDCISEIAAFEPTAMPSCAQKEFDAMCNNLVDNFLMKCFLCTLAWCSARSARPDHRFHKPRGRALGRVCLLWATLTLVGMYFISLIWDEGFLNRKRSARTGANSTAPANPPQPLQQQEQPRKGPEA